MAMSSVSSSTWNMETLFSVKVAETGRLAYQARKVQSKNKQAGK